MAKHSLYLSCNMLPLSASAPSHVLARVIHEPSKSLCCFLQLSHHLLPCCARHIRPSNLCANLACGEAVVTAEAAPLSEDGYIE